MVKRSEITEDMIVRTSDNVKLGKVFLVSDGEFHIAKGLFFPKDYVVRYADVRDIRGKEIFLNMREEDLRKQSTEQAGLAGGASMGAASLKGNGDTSRMSAADATTLRSPGTRLSDASLASESIGTDLRNKKAATERMMDGKDLAIPTYREKLDVDKQEIEAGRVRIRKEVVEEVKEMDVPVHHERVRVERRAVSGPAPDASFQEEEFVVPLRAEEVVVSKHAEQDGEFTIRKEDVEEQRHITERLRHEEIRTEGDLEGTARTLNAPTDDPSRRRY